MENKKVNEIIHLSMEAHRLSDFINKKLPSIKKTYEEHRNGIDKHRDGFEEDGDAIQSFNIRLSYKSFTGTYGNSSVYSDFIPDNSIMRKYFLGYLNKHTEEIFNEMAAAMLKDAKSMKLGALNEIDKIKEQIEQLLSE